MYFERQQDSSHGLLAVSLGVAGFYDSSSLGFVGHTKQQRVTQI